MDTIKGSAPAQQVRRSYQNDQWRVLDGYLETHDDGATYWIDASWLTDMRGDLFDWPLHMAEKNWVDLEAFIRAFEAALRIHKPQFSREIFRRSAQEARELRRYYFEDEAPADGGVI